MDSSGIVALAAVGIWLGLLSLLLILAIRQIGLLTVRLDRMLAEAAAGVPRELERDGLMIGMEVSVEVTAAVPECAGDHAYLLLLSSICTPCRAFAAELQRRRFNPEEPLVALIPGRREAADGLIAMLPAGVRTIRDPEAGELAQRHLRLTTTPSALLIEDGVVVGKAYLQTVDDLLRFMAARATSDASEIARRTRRASARRDRSVKEAASYGD